jgi:tRNA(Arg) A34 adenosine deaminase TadA
LLTDVIRLKGPAWLPGALDPDTRLLGDEERMAAAIALSERNVREGTGGPFGALVVAEDGRVLGGGVNVVVSQCSSICHAEVMALVRAQLHVGRARLSGGDEGRVALVTSAQPCVMCFGASFWAGLDELVVGARGEDVEELSGFDEGPLPADWVGELERRGITVRRDVLRDRSRDVLRSYGQADGIRY